MISVGLESSVESSSTLGDVNYDPHEDVPAEEVAISPQVIVGPFVAQYDATTGIVTLPNDTDTTIIFSNMVLVDSSTNTGYKISYVIDEHHFVIDTGLTADFSKAFISPIDNFYVTSLESVLFKQTFSIKCFAQSDALYTLYLEQIVLFILFRYKEQLLEARGLDNTTVSSGPLYKWTESNTELVFCRDISVQGFSRAYWPKAISPKIQGTAIQGVKIIGGGVTPPSILQEQLLTGWALDGDSFE